MNGRTQRFQAEHCSKQHIASAGLPSSLHLGATVRVLQVTFDRYSPLQTRITQKELQVCTLFTLPVLQLTFLNMYILDNLSEKIRI